MWQVQGKNLVARDAPTMALSVISYSFPQNLLLDDDNQVMDLSIVPTTPSLPTLPSFISSFTGQLIVGATRSFCLEARLVRGNVPKQTRTIVHVQRVQLQQSPQQPLACASSLKSHRLRSHYFVVQI
ncbi:Aste57867_2331 [Aphanomyces stellatus]|uniref:Aste57867_2331 protein n=1 Tax=Aphanomyces stellatus TaxID=120398 RepID=A0A485K8R6_9STRA|nr:hypothetical protein As57867_002326 [Aphanomyces stellatus]VFT79533.1 Aste57867_2331 [Aphanomyces stellatus]